MLKKIMLLGLVFMNLSILPVYYFKSWDDPALSNLLRLDGVTSSSKEHIRADDTDFLDRLFEYSKKINNRRKTLIFLNCLSKRQLDQTKALFFAVLLDDLNLVQDLIGLGFDVNAKYLDKTPIDLAKSPEMVELLEFSGAIAVK